MFKSGLVAFMAAIGCSVFAQPAEADRSLETMWEVLWHQSGVPTRLVRWEGDIKVRVSGVNVAAHKPHTLQALREVAAETGVKVVDVSDQPDAAQQANVNIEIVADSALDANQPCETRLDFQTEARIDRATLLMRDGDARRCAFHEAMHIMGVRGHPEGQTVLSYFSGHEEGLQPLDKAMLRAWYSPRARGGMTPFEVLPILGDEYVAISPDKARAAQARDRFLARTVEQMHAFAEGAGDVPAIVKQSGKSSANGIRFGRMEMSYFLGVAYSQGTTVPRNPELAQQWLQRAAEMGSRTAQAKLAGGGTTVVGATR